MRRTESGRMLTVALLAAAVAVSPARGQEWKDRHAAGLKAMAARDYDKAEGLMKRSLAAAEAPGGGGTHAVVEALVGLGNVYLAQERAAEASVVWDQALLTLVRSQEPAPADLTLVYSGLATLKALQKNYAESESLLKRALAISEKALGPNHSEVASTLNRLADIALMQKNHAEADTFARKALAIREMRPDADPLELAKVYHTLAGLSAVQENYREADALFRRVVELKEKALGVDHPEVATALMEQGSVRLVNGVNGTLFSFLSTLGPAEKARADRNKADARFQETAELLARALAIREKALGRDDPKTLEVVTALVIAETKQEDHARAEPYLKRLLAAREKTLGPRHPEVVGLVDQLADNALAQRKYREAIPLLKRLIAARDAEASKGSGKPADLFESFRLPTLDGDDEKDAPGDLDAKLRRTTRLADLGDDPAARPTEADLAFLKGLGILPRDATLAALVDLRKLDVQGHPIDDAGMDHLRGLVNLKSLAVNPAELTRTVPNITDAGLAPLRKLTDVRNLTLSGTTVRGVGLDQLAGMIELAHLDLSFTLVDDAGLSQLPTFPKLQFLDLSGSKVTDASIPAIKKQAGLTYLGLLGTKISKAGIEEILRGRPALNIHMPDGSSTTDGSHGIPMRQAIPHLVPVESPPVPAAVAPR